MKDQNSFTDDELEMMSHGNNPQSNAYRELLAFRRAAKSDGWIPCAERMPDDSHPRTRVLAYTPNQDDAMTYRALPAGLLRTVARDATHWKYIEPPTTEK